MLARAVNGRRVVGKTDGVLDNLDRQCPSHLVANLFLYKTSKPEVNNCIFGDLTTLFTLRQSGIHSVKDIMTYYTN